MRDQVLFGRKIRALRDDAKLSREKLAERIGKNAGYLGEVERGEKWPSMEIISKIAAGLSVSSSEFFDFEAQEPNPNQLKTKIRHMVDSQSIEDLQLAYRVLKAVFEP